MIISPPFQQTTLVVGNRAQPKYWLHLKSIAFSEALGSQAAFPSEVFLDTLTITDYQREP